MVDVAPLMKEDYTGNEFDAAHGSGAPGGHTGEDEPVPMPSAPPEVSVQGYEGASFTSAAYLAPPSYDESVQPTSDQPRPEPKMPKHISEDQARQALLNLAGQNFCWGKKAAQEMNIGSIESTNAFHYKLETFSEARKSTWAFEPYDGRFVDGPQNGMAPSPWAIAMQPNGMFKSHEKSCEVPHTAYIKTCHGCNGCGQITCRNCNSSGRKLCHSCHGKGYQVHTHHTHDQHGNPTTREENRRCHHCNATGYRICSPCNGSGKVMCRTCRAKGQLRFFIKLTVIWTVHMNEHVVETTALPDHLITQAQGIIAFEETSQRVIPVSHFPHPEINSASQRIVQQHWTSFNNERILSQRHNIRVVPVSEVTANYSDKDFTFWVYGCEQLAYCSQYPQTCCCGCTIL